tara:strand:+ start:182 stop:1144 length:963 start_codon:yes stop_codon:yes gene_type:complete
MPNNNITVSRSNSVESVVSATSSSPSWWPEGWSNQTNGTIMRASDSEQADILLHAPLPSLISSADSVTSKGGTTNDSINVQLKLLPLIINVPSDCNTVSAAVQIARRSKKKNCVINLIGREIDMGISLDASPTGARLAKMGMSNHFTGIFINFPLKISGEGAELTSISGAINVDSIDARDVVIEGLTLLKGGLSVSGGAKVFSTDCIFSKTTNGATVFGINNSTTNSTTRKTSRTSEADFISCEFSDCHCAGISAQNAAHVTMLDCMVLRNGERGIISNTCATIHLRGNTKSEQNGVSNSGSKCCNVHVETSGKIYVHDS